MTHSPSVLTRELADVSDAARTAPPPPRLRDFPRPYRLRPVDPAGSDPETVAAWMSRPHLVETWEQPWPVARWRADAAARLAGTYSLPMILSCEASACGLAGSEHVDIGYVELYRVARDECARLYRADPMDLGVHLAGADAALTGRGILSGWLDLLPAAVWSAEPRCRRVLADPDHRNTPMRKALTRIGWHDLGEFDIRPDRRIALQVCPRTPDDLPVPHPEPISHQQQEQS